MESEVSEEAGGAAGAPPSRVGVFAALGHRDYALFWSGALVSNIGNWVQTTALFWYVKEYTHSDAWVGAVNLANYLPVLIFVLWSGYVADILDRRRLIMATQAVMMLCALALGLCTTFGVAHLPAIMIIAAVAGIAFTFGFPPIQAILPDLVPREEMLNALALSSAQFNLGRVVGPALGALILAWWSVGSAYYINAFTFLFVIGAIWLARTHAEPSQVEHQHPLVHIEEGLRYVRDRRWMMAILAALGIASFFGFSSMVLFPALARDVLGRGSGTYGLLLTLAGLGAAAGAPLVTYLCRYLAEREIVKLGCLGLGLSLLGLSLSRTVWLSCIFSAGVGGVIPHARLGRQYGDAGAGRTRHAWAPGEYLYPDVPGNLPPGRTGAGLAGGLALHFLRPGPGRRGLRGHGRCTYHFPGAHPRRRILPRHRYLRRLARYMP